MKRVAGGGRGSVPFLLSLAVIFAFLFILGLIPVIAGEGESTSPYDLEFQDLTISGTVGGSASYAMMDVVTYGGNGSSPQSSANYSVGSLLETEEATGLENHRWESLR